MIRNYNSATLYDPQAAIRALLIRLNIPYDAERIRIVNHGALRSHSGKSYVLIAFDDISTNI